MGSLGFENAYAFAMRSDRAKGAAGVTPSLGCEPRELAGGPFGLAQLDAIDQGLASWGITHFQQQFWAGVPAVAILVSCPNNGAVRNSTTTTTRCARTSPR